MAGGIEEVFLNRALQRTGTINGILALIGHILERFLIQRPVDVLLFEGFDDALEPNLHDPTDITVAEAVEELGAKVIAQSFGDQGFALLLIMHVHDEPAADIARHDQHGVLEIHSAAMPVGDAAVIQFLQEHFEDIRLRFFHFIENHDAVRAAAHGFAKLPPPRITNSPKAHR